MGPVLEQAGVPSRFPRVDQRVLLISGLALLLAVAAAFIADILMKLIGFINNLSFYGNFSTQMISPAHNHLGWWVVVVPVVGAIIVGFMARYGSAGIRGHGIPEAMEQVLLRESRIPPRLTFLKPLSAAVAIGTGGPFGAEGPIIATGGALGSLIGQLLRITASERKTLLAAGAAAGMAATFGSPVSATLLAVELLLFEFRPRSFIPVALASTAAAGLRFHFGAKYPVFPMPALSHPTQAALAIYILLGAIVGFVSVFVTRAVYLIEDLFEELPIHWMWWPAIGAVAVGVIGYFAPRTLGVGYDNISDIISGSLPLKFMVFLFVMKFVSWAIALGSGTSGGTLAPLFTIGSGVGALLGFGAAKLLPGAGIDPRVAALVGMAALFAGASRALLTSVVFAFETTLQPLGLLPLLGGCASSFFVSWAMMPDTIMTLKITRRGVRVPAEYAADFLDTVIVNTVLATKNNKLVSFRADQTLGETKSFLASGAEGSRHHGFPVLDEGGHLIGVLTRRNLLDSTEPLDRRVRELITRPPMTIAPNNTLREAADTMVEGEVGRLPVVDPNEPGRVLGIITRSDLLSAHRKRLREGELADPAVELPGISKQINRRRRLLRMRAARRQDASGTTRAGEGA
jgi:H+/Cl- antiporter ClcA